jgi:hypothetical protein
MQNYVGKSMTRIGSIVCVPGVRVPRHPTRHGRQVLSVDAFKAYRDNADIQRLTNRQDYLAYQAQVKGEIDGLKVGTIPGTELESRLKDAATEPKPKP